VQNLEKDNNYRIKVVGIFCAEYIFISGMTPVKYKIRIVNQVSVVFILNTNISINTEN